MHVMPACFSNPAKNQNYTMDGRMTDEWSTGRHGGWGGSENDLVKIRIKMILHSPAYEDGTDSEFRNVGY